MPVKPENKALYPKNWKEIRAQILERAGNKCEMCGVPNYAVGHREQDGTFVRTCGNYHFDAAGFGELSYKEARELAAHANDCGDGMGPNGERGVVIVLTIAHTPDDSPTNCDPSNLKALCNVATFVWMDRFTPATPPPHEPSSAQERGNWS